MSAIADAPMFATCGDAVRAWADAAPPPMNQMTEYTVRRLPGTDLMYVEAPSGERFTFPAPDGAPETATGMFLRGDRLDVTRGKRNDEAE